MGAVSDHLAAGLEVGATPGAALTIRDDLDQVRDMGIEITDGPPPGSCEITLSDIDMGWLAQVFRLAGIPRPQAMLVAAQDHGHAPSMSNRKFRFSFWEKFVARGGQMENLLFTTVPSEFTRLAAIQASAGGARVMDSGAAALMGILGDPAVYRAYQGEGVVAVNLGNSHVVAALMRQGRVWGLMEHHTRKVDPPTLARLIDRLRAGTITSSEVLESGGHGAVLEPAYRPGSGFGLIAQIGPRRNEFRREDVLMAHPYGHMMLAGCYGLLIAAGLLVLGGEGAGDGVLDSS